MEEKQIFPRATGFSGKILIALLFILSGILLFARNMGWITSEVFDLIVSWHSPFHRWNHPFADRCVFFDWRAFLVTGKFTGNGVAPRSDNSRCFIYLQTRQK